MAVTSAVQVEKPGHCMCALTLGKHSAFTRSGREVFCIYAARLGWGSQEKDRCVAAAQRLRQVSAFLPLEQGERAKRALAKAGPGSG